MTDWRRRTILFIAFLYLVNAAGLHIHGDDIGVQNSGEDEASIANLSFRSTQELSQKHRVELSSPWMKLALRHSMLTPSRVLDEVVLQNNETWDVGTNASDFAQVSLDSSSGRSWCIAKSYATPDEVQASLNWACGFGGADCEPIQLGNPCFTPNTVYSHASYAFNSYYQIHQHASETCDFDGTSTVVYEDPSYSGCLYSFRSGQPGAPPGAPTGVFINEASRSSISSIKALTAMSILLPMWVL